MGVVDIHILGYYIIYLVLDIVSSLYSACQKQKFWIVQTISFQSRQQHLVFPHLLPSRKRVSCASANSTCLTFGKMGKLVRNCVSNTVSSIKLPATMKGHLVIAPFVLPFYLLVFPVFGQLYGVQ